MLAGFSGYIAVKTNEVKQNTTPTENCTFENDIRAREIIIWTTAFSITYQSGT